MSYTPPQPAQLSAQDERLWATLTHVIAGAVHIVTATWAGFVAALVAYFVFRDRGPFVRAHTIACLNFQLTMLIGVVIGWATIWLLIGAIILAAVAVLNIIFSILAALAANRGEYYTYPLAIAFVK